MELTPWTFAIVLPLVALAGFVDAAAGGGGLISLPAYLAAGLPAQLASGTNKMGSVFGSALATAKYAREGRIAWRAAIPAVVGALPGAALGARLLLLVPEGAAQIFLLIAVPVVAVVLFFRRDRLDAPEEAPVPARPWVCLLIGLLVGMYDGFVGPGTGTFLMLAFSAFCRMDLVRASGSAKLVNLASNLAAMLTFLSSGSVLVALAIPAALCSMAGNYLGASLAVRKGARFIRPLSFAVLALLLVTIAVERFALR